MTVGFTAKTLEQIKLFASLPQTPISLKKMTQFGRVPSPGTLIRASQFMRDELQIRLAHRVVELENLPHGLSEMNSVKKVKQWYTQSFHDLISFPHPSVSRVPADFVLQNNTELNGNEGQEYYDPLKTTALIPQSVLEYNQNFSKLLEKIKNRHDPVVSTIAQGVVDIKNVWKKSKKFSSTQQLPLEIQSFLDRFYMSRIGIRMLIGQHVAISKASFDHNSVPENYVGIICTKTPLMQVVQDAAENAKFICNDYYGLWGGPEVKFIGKENITQDFCYVPSHLHHMVFELLKNSLRAVVERYGIDCEDFPDIKIVFAEGKEDITIKISDEGGGIPRSGLPLIWSYMYTTAENPLLEEDFSKNDFKAPLAG
ncbi:hypothetical protein HK099_004411 [Clydaea vesicula]|uniref:Protein-serine/threonine kinase n=1 Tax=Clydaea vesicula TaxID=447962 RepID=A0AAD5Y1A9_9FUNG|nr:hypothetical protein HK099_004411 [Clydaea vesicula]